MDVGRGRIARSGNPGAISEYLGGSNAFDRCITGFSEHYVDQNEQDSQGFVRAFRVVPPPASGAQAYAKASRSGRRTEDFDATVRAGGARQIGGLTKPVGHSLHLAAGPHSGGDRKRGGPKGGCVRDHRGSHGQALCRG